ncbi:hypothetical protein POM88_016706 [Heracleum sosnowskyi]|uniref:Dilute domain-containing protein n=1 Tax=Heracleum sosnowskyi TaxID=360622 RepID=A0AAD8IPG3_9APIA|nr:hypothetical protein POM88_016706 [Heracleum sosnowskyi]
MHYPFLYHNGEYVKNGLAELEHWCYKATEEYAGSAWDEFKHIRQAIGFLVMHLNTLHDDVLLQERSDRADISSKLCSRKCNALSSAHLKVVSTLDIMDVHLRPSLQFVSLGMLLCFRGLFLSSGSSP